MVKLEAVVSQRASFQREERQWQVATLSEKMLVIATDADLGMHSC